VAASAHRRADKDSFLTKTLDFLGFIRLLWTVSDDYGKQSGAQGRNRTTDTAIFSRMLYQLSYLGGRGVNAEARAL
jgi:hypothetical protein